MMAGPWTSPCNNTNSTQMFGKHWEQLASGIILAVVSLITILSNGLLLVALRKDPLRTFRTPSTLFVSSMTVANLLNGVAVGPLIVVVDKFSCCFSFGVSSTVIQMRHIFPAITMNASFFTVLLLSFDQYAAVAWARKYKSIICRRNVLASITCVWVYTTLFSLLPLMGTPLRVYSTVDLYMNTTVAFLLLILSYVGLFCALRTHTKRRATVEPTLHNVGLRQFAAQRHKRERRYIVLVLVLMLLVSVTIVPNMIFWIVQFHFPSIINSSYSLNILKHLPLIKFALDPFVYAWRLPRYRKALYLTVACQ